MQRELFEPAHEAFRERFVAFLNQEVIPHYGQWEQDGIMPRSLFSSAGANSTGPTTSFSVGDIWQYSSPASCR